MPDFIEPGLLVPIVIIVILVIVIFSAGYRKAPPDKAFIISGLRRKAKVVIGKATVKLPFFERCDVLELALMSVASRPPRQSLLRITSTSPLTRW